MALKKNIWPSYPKKKKKNPYFNHILGYLSPFYHHRNLRENKTSREKIKEVLGWKELLLPLRWTHKGAGVMNGPFSCLGADLAVTYHKHQWGKCKKKCSSLSSLCCSIYVLSWVPGRKFPENVQKFSNRTDPESYLSYLPVKSLFQ